MKKIFSILLALSVVLGLLAAAVPAMADVEGPIDDSPAVSFVGANMDCAGCGTAMNITFNISATVETGASICIDFPADTTVPPTGTTDWKDGDIEIRPVGAVLQKVLGAEVIVSSSAHGTQVCFVNPGPDLTTANNPISVIFTSAAGLKNPTTPGDDYTLFVWTSRLADSTPVESHKYTIKPYYSTYKWTWDSSPTYPGLAPGFVPPFKMSGQNCTGTNMTGCSYCSTIPGFLNAFNITFEYDTLGCFAPCNNVSLYFHLKEVPAEDCEVTLCINYTCWTMDDDDICKDVEFANIPLAGNTSVTFNASAHFECKGDYQICFLAKCVPAACAPPCCPPEELPEENYTIKVYQWKEACKIPIYRKWNLISLPLVPLTDPAPDIVLSALPDWDEEIVSVWYYDREAPACNGQWLCYAPSPDTDLPDYCSTLTNMEDGPAYWVRAVYDPTDPPGTGDGMGAFLGYLWVWGTTKPVPPNSPSVYDVCAGWNMVGYTEGCQIMSDDDYLWNFQGPPIEYAGVYGWNASLQIWDPTFAPTTVRMKTGKGYWIPFAGAGQVCPP